MNKLFLLRITEIHYKMTKKVYIVSSPEYWSSERGKLEFSLFWRTIAICYGDDTLLLSIVFYFRDFIADEETP